MSPIALAALLAAAVGPAAAAGPATPLDVWVNPTRLVEVRIGRCGDSLCGDMVGATAGAVADARKAGTATLIGTRVVFDYEPAKFVGWQGTVFVPDMNGRYGSRMTQPSADTLTVSGCLMSGVPCQRQTWTRSS